MPAEAAQEERRAIAEIRRAPAHQLELSRYYGARANSLDRLGNHDEAMGLYERTLAIATEGLGAGHLTVIELQINYSQPLRRGGQLDHARSVLESALRNMPARYRDTDFDAALIHSGLATCRAWHACVGSDGHVLR
ncbi:MAG TPA: tetratricopeptide repeat protein [Kofleriaceae bacterium]|nr:tetratricopeptide repeat protein [Kofleriaceae bacterium]